MISLFSLFQARADTCAHVLCVASESLAEWVRKVLGYHCKTQKCTCTCTLYIHHLYTCMIVCVIYIAHEYIHT